MLSKDHNILGLSQVQLLFPNKISWKRKIKGKRYNLQLLRNLNSNMKDHHPVLIGHQYVKLQNMQKILEKIYLHLLTDTCCRTNSMYQVAHRLLQRRL